MEPFISVCIPVYNVKSFIVECIESVLKQDFIDYEINLVDNGSDDGTLEICEEYADKYRDKINFFKFDRPTVIGRAFRKTFQMSKGKYIIYLDSDDYLIEGYFKDIYKNYLENEKDIYMIDYEVLYEDGITERQKNTFVEEKINNANYVDAVKYIVSNNTFLFALWKCVYRRETLGEIFLQTPDIEMPNSDVYMQLMFFLKSKSIHYIKESYYVYRLRQSSVSNSKITSEKVKFLFVALLVMFDLVNYKTDFSREFIKEISMPFIRRYMKIVTGNFHQLDKKEMIFLSKYIDNNKITHTLSAYNEKWIQSLYNCLSEYGSLEGLSIYFNIENRVFLEKSKKLIDREIYVFPTGAYGENTANLLLADGHSVKGFLDNSSLKESMLVNGLKCHIPNEHLFKENIENTAVVIASVYEEYSKSMKSQVVSLGIADENIIIRDIDAI